MTDSPDHACITRGIRRGCLAPDLGFDRHHVGPYRTSTHGIPLRLAVLFCVLSHGGPYTGGFSARRIPICGYI